MVSLRTASTGRRRYGMGNSYAPTRGQVNPQGYIERELKKRSVGRWNQPVQGADRFGGVSNRRSGLAQRALANIPKPKAHVPRVRPITNMPKPFKTPLKGGPIARGKAPKYQGPKGGFHAPKFKGGGGNKNKQQRPPTVASPAAPVPSAPAQLAPPRIPTVKINANGQLDLPFDEAFGLGLVEQQQAMDAELLDLQQQEQEWGLEFGKAQRDLDINYEDVKRDTLNDNSARGMAFSSGYANDISQNATTYNNYLNDLRSEDTAARTGFSNARTGIENAMNDYIRQAVYQQAMDLAAGAGDLGYGVTEGAAPGYAKAPKLRGGGGGGNKNNKPKPKPNVPKGGFHMPKNNPAPKPKPKPKGKK